MASVVLDCRHLTTWQTAAPQRGGDGERATYQLAVEVFNRSFFFFDGFLIIAPVISFTLIVALQVGVLLEQGRILANEGLGGFISASSGKARRDHGR